MNSDHKKHADLSTIGSSLGDKKGVSLPFLAVGDANRQAKHSCRQFRGFFVDAYRGVRLRILLSVFICLGASSCANLAGPEYKRPDLPDKDAWAYAGEKPSASETIRPDWWTEFGDQTLDRLIEEAIAENIDIQVLAGRIGVARAGIAEAKAGGLPTLLAAGGIDYTKNSGLPSTTQYSVAGSVDWELDIWGKIKKGVEAQEAEYHATGADWRAGYLTLVSDVATTYFSIRTFDEQVVRQKDTLETNERILAIYNDLYREGQIPETQVLQQRSEVANLKSGLFELQRRRAVAENGLATLLGRPAGQPVVLAAHVLDRVKIVDVPMGLPSELVARRPDMVAAEYRLLSAHNLVGQARLARLPTIALSGRAGSASFELTDLLKAYTFGFSPSITFPVFDPFVRSRIKITDAQTKVATDQYRAVVIRAFEEVENALINLSSHRKQRVELNNRLADLQIVAQAIRAQLAEGLVSQLQVFESERSLLSAELELLTNHQRILFDTVSLYKTLGGGWPVEQVGQSET